MSFDVNLVCLRNGLPDTFPSSIVRQALYPFIQRRDGKHLTLVFPDGGGGDTTVDEEEATGGVCIMHASGADLYDALFEILRQTHSILIWSFGGCVVASPSVIPDLPEGLIESVGVPTIVHNGADILAEIAKT